MCYLSSCSVGFKPYATGNLSKQKSALSDVFIQKQPAGDLLIPVSAIPNPRVNRPATGKFRIKKSGTADFVTENL